MTRGIIGVVLLLVLLAGRDAVPQWTMDKIQSPITQELTQAARGGRTEAVERGHASTSRPPPEPPRKGWRVTAALADHMPMEDIDSLFARLYRPYAAAGRDRRCMPPPAGSWPAAWKPWQMPTD